MNRQADWLVQIQRYSEGQLSPTEIAALSVALRENDELRKVFLEMLNLDAAIEEAAIDASAIDDPAVCEAGIDDAANVTLAAAQPEVESSTKTETPIKSPVLGFLGGAVDYVNHSRRLMFLLVAVMLCGWFVFQIGSVLLGRWWAGNNQVADRGADHPGGPAAKPADARLPAGAGQSHGTALAWVSGSVGARWQIVAAKPNAGNPAEPEFWEIGTEFIAKQEVNLVAGLGEITFRSGAKVVISAPAKFSVTSALVTDLQLGKLSARVPHASAQQGSSQPGTTSFTVNTPAGSVVDLGTEFGVEVTPDHKLDVQVFVGEVKVNSTPVDGSTDGGNDGVHVTAGKTVHVEPGHPATVGESQDKDRFQRDLKIAKDSSDKQMAAYLDLMRQLKPVVWLRMEGKEGDKTIHDEAGGPDAKLTWDGPGNPFTSGAVGKSLWLRGPRLKDCAIVPDYPKAEHGKLSVSAWVFADSRPRWASILCNWGQAAPFGQFSFGLRSKGERESGVDLAVAFQQRDGKLLFAEEGEEHPFPLHEWEHVAFTTDGATMRVYREGREVASLPHRGLLFPTPVKSLGVGAKSRDTIEPTKQDDLCWWDGKLDEVAVFNDVLTPEDVKKLAAAPPR